MKPMLSTAVQTGIAQLTEQSGYCCYILQQVLGDEMGSTKVAGRRLTIDCKNVKRRILITVDKYLQ